MFTIERIILILGASSEVGCQLIRQIAHQYTKIIAHYNHSQTRLMDLADELSVALCLEQADFSDAHSTNSFIERIKEYHGITDVVHCSAVYCINERFHKISIDRFSENFNVEFRSVAQVLQVCLPAMAKAKKGKIVFLLTSCTQEHPPAYLSDYVSIKYALLGLMRALSTEYASKRICINAVSPSMMKTRFLKNIPDMVIEEARNKSPRKQLISVEDTVNTIVFLLSEQTDAITGENIFVTGGS